MAKTILNVIVNFLATIVQVITTPLYVAITNGAPEVDNALNYVQNHMNVLFNGINYFIGMIPPNTLTALRWGVSVAISCFTIWLATKVVIMCIKIYGKVKPT